MGYTSINKLSYHSFSGCLKSVSPFLNAVDNIDLWKVDLENPDKILKVTLDNDNINTVVEAVTQVGFKIEKV